MHNQEIYHSDKMRLINRTSCSKMINWKFEPQTYDFDKNNQKIASQIDYNVFSWNPTIKAFLICPTKFTSHEIHQNSIWSKFPLYIHLISH